MNADLSIHRMAFREAESLGVAQALVAKKRQEFEQQLLRERVNETTSSSRAGIDSVLRRMDEASDLVTRAQSDTLVGIAVDKTA